MPELPEVETIVRYLRPKVRGKRILGIEVYGKRVLRNHRNPEKFKRTVTGKKVETIGRIGKNIIFVLDDGTRLVFHLMMTGQLLLNPRQKAGHERLRMRLSGGNCLVFNDVRQFGWCRIIKLPQQLVGPDALSLNFKIFKSLIRPRRVMIKNLLLNQKFIAGIGNIYSDEILWHAGIKPMRKADSLTSGEIKKLYAAMRHVLNLAIRKEGTSARDYRKPDGSEGGYYEIRKVYQRAGDRCSRCGAIIKRIKVGSRSAHFCPKHQK